MKMFIIFFIFTIMQNSRADSYQEIDPSFEFTRSDFVGFVSVEETFNKDNGDFLIRASIRLALKGGNEKTEVYFYLQNADDLLKEHAHYFVLLYEGKENVLTSYDYQSVFPDYCYETFGDCNLLSKRRSIFTQGNLFGTDDLILGFTVINDNIHAVINWAAANSKLLSSSNSK